MPPVCWVTDVIAAGVAKVASLPHLTLFQRLIPTIPQLRQRVDFQFFRLFMLVFIVILLLPRDFHHHPQSHFDCVSYFK